MTTAQMLSLAEARRLAVAAQGFGPRPPAPATNHLRQLANRIYAFQIDSVNVLARAHYVPAFARLGPYPVAALDALAYTRRELFEYWGHAACLLPLSLYPLVRYRMDRHVERLRRHMRSRRGAYLARVYDEVAERGPLRVADLTEPGKRSGNWWGWSKGKMALEYLYDAGLAAIAGRRGFERLYDLAERVIPQHVREAPAPSREEAMKRLVCLGAKACGVGTAEDIAQYFDVDGWRDRLPPGRWLGEDGAREKPILKRLVAELVDEGRLLSVHVEGWKQTAYVTPAMRIAKAVDSRGLVTPFDSLVWDRARLKRLFGMEYTIEIYTPAPQRVYGYYVCPFLLGDQIVARCDLKADREREVLVVPAAFLEAGQSARRIAPALAGELRHLQAWLGLSRIEVGMRGDLAGELRRASKRD
jgi:uncharacterized protein